MDFYGISKVTLIDFPGKVACTVFTHGCNLRCPFCHNPELVVRKPDAKAKITDIELLEFLSRRKKKLDGVVLTGGEPLMRFKELLPVIREIKKLGFAVKIDTNGTYPGALTKLVKEKLVDFIALDFKGTRTHYLKFMKATESNFNSFKKTVQIVKKSHLPYEIRATVTPGIHSAEDIPKMCSYIRGARKLIIQNFVPNDSIDPRLNSIQGFEHKTLLEFRKKAKRFVTKIEIRNDLNRAAS